MSFLLPVFVLASSGVGGLGASLEPPVFDVPKAQQSLVIDGLAEDWRDSRLHVGSLLAAEEKDDSGQFSALALVAWDNEGLCILVQTRGGSGVEAGNPGAIFEASGVELFVSTGHHNRHAAVHAARDVLQPIIAPGRDPQHEAARCYIYDQRIQRPVGNEPARCEFATRVEGNKVTYEVRIPWSQFGLSPQEGMMLGLQIHANDADAFGRRTQLRWNAATGKGQTLRLAGPGEHRSAGTATASYDDWTRIRVAVHSAPNRTVTASAGAKSASAVTGADGHAILELPMPPWGEPGAPIRVADDSGSVFAWVELPDATKARISFLEAMPVSFSGDNVFAGGEFPPMDPLPESVARSLIEPGSVRVQFFNREGEERTAPDMFGRYLALVSMRSKGGKEITRRLDLFRAKEDIDPQLSGTANALAEAAGVAEPISDWDRKLFESVRQNVNDNFKRRIFGRAATLSALHERNEQAVRVMTSRLNAWYRLDKKLGTVERVQHMVLLPPGHEAQPERIWPVVVFLHGTGGHNEAAALAEPIREFWRDRPDREFILLQPLAPRGASWVPDQLIEWLDKTLPQIHGDPARVVLTGFSMGGIGTWNVACAYPQRFAAFVPLASVGDFAPVDAVVGRPVWCFHGDRDAMPWKPASEWIESLRRLDPAADVRFTLLDNTDHTNTSARVYQRSDLREWINKHLRSNSHD